MGFALTFSWVKGAKLTVSGQGFTVLFCPDGLSLPGLVITCGTNVPPPQVARTLFIPRKERFFTKMCALLQPWFDRLHRLRTGKGFGVQSPFAYELIRNVFREPLPFYAFHEPDLRAAAHADAPVFTADKERVCRMLFRLTVFFTPETVCIAGHDGRAAAYVVRARSKTRVLSLTSLRTETTDVMCTAPMVYLPLGAQTDNFVDALCRGNHHFPPGKVVIIGAIGREQKAAALWKKLLRETQPTVTFDLNDAGVAVYDATKTPGHYRLFLL